jgi:hypothetical protein
MTAFVLGNGVSRKGIDLHGLKKHGEIFGCNALYREFNPDVLVSTDPGISREIQDSGWPKRDGHIHWTRRPFADSGSKKLDPVYSGMSSGPNALNLACRSKQEHWKIYLLGFDLGSVGDLFNNLYADSEHYKKSTEKATFGGNWFNQIMGIMNEHKNIDFYRVVTDASRNYDKISTIKNLKTITKTEFQSLYK